MKRSNVFLALGLTLSLVGCVGTITGLAAFPDHRRTSEAAEKEREGSSSSPTVELVRDYPMPDFDDLDPAGENDPAADDGELHDARNTDVAYTFKEGFWAKSGVERVEAYGGDVDCSFAVQYPQLQGSLEHLDQINELLRSTAMATVRTYYEDPGERAVSLVGRVMEGEDASVMPLLSSTVTYAVTYNSDELLSVCYSDSYCVGSYAAEFLQLRTVNVNLKTGEAYTLGDVLAVDDAIATSFVDNLVRESGSDDNDDGRVSDDECFTIRLCGRDAFVQAVQGKGELAGDRVSTCLFVDGNGKPNLGVNYWVSGDDGFVRGWWDVTITDEQAAAARKESPFWELLGGANAEGSQDAE